ncbi:MAG TPA: LptF/LptG family permease, partial [Desulfuromonadaceae bacterium]|nr:LptF/LptG family permease [Desulfuromonadaceae bacterium]
LTFCLVGIQAFVVVFIVFTDLSKIQDSKLHFVDTVEYSIASSATFLPIVLPMSLLVGLLITLTGHSRHNEITAMRAAGVSLWRICAPYFVVGFVFTIILFVLNERWVAQSGDWADSILERHAPKRNADTGKRVKGFQSDRARRTWLFEDADLSAARLSGHVQVTWALPDGSSRQIYADRAVRTNGVWVFYSAAEYMQRKPTERFVPFLQTNALAMPEFDELPSDIERELKFSQYEGLHALKTDVPLSELWPYLQAHPNLPRGKANEWWTKFHERLAEPWTCLVVVLIALPFGAASGRRNLFFGVAGSIFICFVFFVIQKISLAIGTGGYLPPWLAAWSPNLIFGATGIFLTSRVR